MKKIEIKNVKVRYEGDISEKSLEGYVDYAISKHKGSELVGLAISENGEFANLEYEFASPKFDRIRRITGYLVGTTDQFNNGKAAEERDRVKHG